MFYESTFGTVDFRVTTFYVSTLRHNPCFGHKVHVLQRPRFLSSFFIRLCYIVHVLQIYVLRICVIRLHFSSNEVSNTPRFASLRFAQSTFESPRFTSQHFGKVHAFGHKVHVLQRPRFLSSSYVCTLSMFYKSTFYESALYDFIFRQSKSLYEPAFCTVFFRVTTFYVSTLRHSPCFGHEVHVLQRPRFLSSS